MQTPDANPEQTEPQPDAGRSPDPHDLGRFVAAQDAGGTYRRAVEELRAGGKRSHWMWFVFPQVAGLGRSETAQRYALPGLAAARGYLAHPVLGPRLLECARVLAGSASHDPVRIMGSTTDAVKLRSSMTLFARADPDEPVFREVLEKFFDGEDPATLERI